MTSKEAMKRIKTSHHIAMDMLCEGRKDEETEMAISKIEQELELFEKCKDDNCNYQIENAKLIDKFDAYYELHKQLEKGYDELSVDNDKLIQENRNLKKIIELIVNKCVNTLYIDISKDVKEYNGWVSKYYQLTQEEYKLVKEWLKND